MVSKVCLGCSRLFPANLIPRGRCAECKRADWRARNQRRDPFATTVYRSSAYRAARAVVLAGATHCAWCKRPATEVGPLTAGHIRPIRMDPEMAADPAGLAPSCRSCQEKEKHRR
jgi:hypothetical protein